jgi:ceramide glucosyltransferase
VTWFSGVLLGLTVIGTLYYVLSMLAVVTFFRGKRVAKASDAGPKVSVFKPVRGLDRDAASNFASYLRQDHADYEVLFGTLEADDPAIGTILDTIQGHKRASLHIGTTIRGSNNKVRTLHQLAKHASGEILIVTDADTQVEPNFINAIIAPFEDESVGAVTCLYKGVRARGLADALEGLHMTCVFAPGVACARSLGGVDFGLGAAIAIRASVLREIGGFEPIADYLADDFQLGRRPARLGYRVELSKYVIDEVLSGESVRSVLARELRWSRTTRACRPLGHLGLVFTFGFAYASMFLAASGLSGGGWGVFGCVLAIRLATAWVGARRLGDQEFVRRIYLLPARDLLSFGIWVAGYLGRTVVWRGRRLRVTKDGRMVRV